MSGPYAWAVLDESSHQTLITCTAVAAAEAWCKYFTAGRERLFTVRREPMIDKPPTPPEVTDGWLLPRFLHRT